MKVLLSGFKAFNNENINPSLLIVNEIKNKYKDVEIVELNVEYNNDSLKLINKIKEINPDIILLIGQAGGRSKVCLEYFALNMQSATIADNTGVNLLHNLINTSGENAYYSTINLKDLVYKINDNNLTISYNAGTFVCNEIYYSALQYLNKNKLNTPCVFVHVPFIKQQVINKENVAFLELNESILIVEKVLNEIKNTLYK